MIKSFRSKVIISISVVVILASYCGLFIFETILHKKNQENSIEDIKMSLEFFQESYVYELGKHGEESLVPVLMHLSYNHSVSNVVLLNSVGQPLFIADTSKPKISYQIIIDEITQNDGSILLQTNGVSNRAILALENKESCNSCHNSSGKNLGYIVVDFFMHDLDEAGHLIDMFGLYFALSLLSLIFIIVIMLHFRFVRGSLKQFKIATQKIKDGNLEIRVPILVADELGTLATSFNDMLDNVQNMQKQISGFHEREMKNAQKMATVGEMAAIVAHEIKNPLTGISNAIEILVDEMPESSSKMGIMKEIHRQVSRVNKTINTLLKFSRPIDMQMEQGDINELILSVVFFLEKQTEKGVVEFRTSLSKNIPIFNFDHEQMEAVFTNLGQNALHALTEKGVIEFITEYDYEKDTLIIKVKDTGSGISEEDMKKVFKPFYTTRSKGTGLGLSIANDIIEQHGGHIMIKSQIGQGTTMIISLPIQNSFVD